MNKVNAAGTLSRRGTSQVAATGGAQQNNQYQLLQQLLCTRIHSFFQSARSLGQGLSHSDKFSPQGLKQTTTNVSLLFVYTTVLEIICWFAARYPIVMTNNHSMGLPTGPCLEEITSFLWVLSGSNFCNGFSSFIGCRKPQSWYHSTSSFPHLSASDVDSASVTGDVG